MDRHDCCLFCTRISKHYAHGDVVPHWTPCSLHVPCTMPFNVSPSCSLCGACTCMWVGVHLCAGCTHFCDALANPGQWVKTVAHAQLGNLKEVFVSKALHSKKSAAHLAQLGVGIRGRGCPQRGIRQLLHKSGGDFFCMRSNSLEGIDQCSSFHYFFKSLNLFLTRSIRLRSKTIFSSESWAVGNKSVSTHISKWELHCVV